MPRLSLEEFRNRITNKDFTLIARDCVGGILYHQLGLKFLSPTINLFFIPEEFNYFCLNLKEYIAGELVELVDNDTPYPVGLIYPVKGASITRPVRVDFMHYDSFEQAKNKWNVRKQRINWNNLFVLSTFCYEPEIATLTPQLIEDWNKIPYKKAMIVNQKYGFKKEFVINKPEECEEFAWLLFTPGKKPSWRRTFNKFNFINFLNT